MQKEYNLGLNYHDVFLTPQKGILKSRDEASVGLSFITHSGSYKFKVPVVPANMDSCINVEKAIELAELGYFYVMHRFGDNRENSKLLQNAPFTSVSVGVRKEDRDFILWAKENVSLEFITIDIAHGHSEEMIKMVEFIKRHLEYTYLIAGNVGTYWGVVDLYNAGANCVKVGIGGGNTCETYDRTGFTTPMFSTVMDCARCQKIPIIADGGIKKIGDISKAIYAGASMVMMGSMFSRCLDSPAPVTYVNNSMYKVFSGSSTLKDRYIEGRTAQEPARGDYFTLLQEIEEGLRSAVSYSGGKGLSDLMGKAKDNSWGIIK